MKKRQNYFRLYRRGLISSSEYHRFRNFVTRQIREAKEKFYSELFEKFKNDSRKTWKVINGLIRNDVSSSSDNSVQCLNMNGVSINENKDISNAFNSHFATIGEKISDSCQTNLNDHLTFMSHKSLPNSFNFRPISTQNVINAIENLKNKNCHNDTYPNRILKALKYEISPVLANIYNRSILTEYFPDFLKTGTVIPLFKSGSKYELGNYRPISILSPFSKIFERLVFDQLLDYLDKFKVLTDSQFGFRNKRSTSQAILDTVLHIQNNNDAGNISISFFLDFQKAFDYVNHKILLSKLSV